VDRIPLLKHIPGYGRELKEFHKFEIKLYRDQIDRVRSEMETNRSGNSFMRTLLDHTNEYRLERDEMAYLAGGLFGAGSETSAVTITNMIVAAACYPEAQRRVQEELDIAFGKDRLPTWEGYESLPQVQAFVLEALRWRPVVPIDGCFLDHEDREIDGTFLQESHTAPLGTSSGGVNVFLRVQLSSAVIGLYLKTL